MENLAPTRVTSKPIKYACERCHNSKLKCTFDRSESTEKCTRCLRADTQCTIKQPAPRRRRRRAEARITNLEEELRTMKSMLSNLQDSHERGPQSTTLSSQTPSTSSIGVDAPPSSNAAWFVPDVVSYHFAEKLFQDFVDSILPEYLIVVIQESFAAMLISKPVLLLASVTAASSTREPSLFGVLHSHLVRQVTDRAIVEGDRSIELIQSIIILAIWYYPPDDLRHLNFYQWIHIAGTMALQIGLGGVIASHESDIDEQHSERWRTMFAVFQSCSSVAISLRRECMVTFTAEARDMLDIFDTLATSVHDKRIVLWVRLQLIAETVETTKWNDAACDLHNLLDQFDQWERRLEPGLMNVSLDVHFHYCKIKLFETVLDVDQDLQELIPPFLSKSQQTKPPNTIVSQSYITAVLGLVSACHSILDRVIGMDKNLLRGCPSTTFAKMLHALKVLSMLKRAWNYPNHAIHYAIDEDSLKLNSYLDSTSSKLEAAAGELKCRVPWVILSVVNSIATQNRETETSRSATSDAYVLSEGHTQSVNAGRQEPTPELMGPSQVMGSNFTVPLENLDSTMPSFYSDGFDIEAPPDLFGLPDFEEMFLPGPSATYGYYPDA